MTVDITQGMSFNRGTMDIHYGKRKRKILNFILKQKLICTLIFVFILSLGVRIVAVDTRPLHGDEAVNWYFANQTRELGYAPYSHTNFHGPTLFYIVAAAMELAQDSSPQTLRLAGIIPGVVCCLAPAILFPYVPLSVVLWAGVLMALSPSAVFFSRYAIHESLFVCLSSLLILLSLRWFLSGSKVLGVVIGITLGFLLATKETWLIVAAAWMIILYQAMSVKELFVFTRPGNRGICILLVTAITILCVTLTGGFQNNEAIVEFFWGVSSWLARSNGELDNGSARPFWYYINLIYEVEPYLLLGVLAPFVFISSHKKNVPVVLSRIFSTWFIVILAIYSAIPYKMPWLLINMTYPLTLCLALILSSSHSFRRTVRISIILLSVLCTSYFVFVNPFGTNHPFCRYHTSLDVLPIIDKVKGYLASHPEANVLVASNQHWPLPYYLEMAGLSHQVEYATTAVEFQYVERASVAILGWEEPRLTEKHRTKTDFWLNERNKLWLYLK